MFVIDKELCSACGDCKDACPCDAIVEHDIYCEIDPDLCAECGACQDVCEQGAVSEQESPSVRV